MSRELEIARGWLRVPYDGPPNSELKIRIGDEPIPAFYDRDTRGAWAMVRFVKRNEAVWVSLITPQGEQRVGRA